MSTHRTTIRGPLLNPQQDGSIDFIADAALQWDESGMVCYAGPAAGLAQASRPDRLGRGVILPPLLDCHIHIPQWPIRGRFCAGVEECPTGRLLEGLNRNVFPFEARCADPAHAAATIAAFAADTLAHGVVGGAAYMTVHAAATAAALAALSDFWSVGLVLMNQRCPEYLRTDETNLERDISQLAAAFGHRCIVTDRFAVAVDSPLRRRAAALAARHGLRMQTHLNEQPSEKQLIEQTLYPDADSYTDVYRRDGLLDRQPILAHSVHMSDQEFDLVASFSGAAIAHCPTSNTLLGSGIMPLDAVLDRGIPYAICTDVGASPTTSLLAEMAQFLKVHAGSSARATPSEALFRTTLGAAQVLGIDEVLGTLAVGRPASFIEVECSGDPQRFDNVDEIIRSGILQLSQRDLNDFAQSRERALLAGGGLESVDALRGLEDSFRHSAAGLETSVKAVTLAGKQVWSR
jgi:guanine deaminase